jgi:hypothetical protein
VTAFLIDEKFPIAAAALLRDTYGHGAVHVAEAGLRAAEDAQVAAVARGEGRRPQPGIPQRLRGLQQFPGRPAPGFLQAARTIPFVTEPVQENGLDPSALALCHLY